MSTIESLLADCTEALRARDYARLQRTCEGRGEPVAVFMHALARVGQGQLASGLSQARRQLGLPLQPMDQATALKFMGLVLKEAGHPEIARSWLEQAAALRPGDPETAEVLRRCLAPDYLAPEVYAPAQDTTLRRYAPREADHYVYAIDVVGTCNLRCPTCPVGNMPLGDRSRGFMSAERFRATLDKIVGECPDPNPQIWLFNWGEPLLHPQIAEFVRAIGERGLKSFLSSNLNVRPRVIDAVIAADPTDLKISLSGASEATYSRTHVRGRFDRVVANLRGLREAVDRHGASTRIWVGHHVYRHNRDEVGEMAELCRELGFEHHPVLAFFQPLEALMKLAEGETLDQPVLDLLVEHPRRYIERFREHRDRRFDCELRFNQTVINHDGSVALCCSTYTTENQLGVDFLDQDQVALDALKYRHDTCRRCYHHGLQYAPTGIHDVQP